MDKKSTIYKIINLFWVPISWIPFFGGMGIIYAGCRVKHTRWIDEGILYMIPFMMLSFIVFGATIPSYLGILVCLITFIRSITLIKPFLNKLEELNNQKEQQTPQKQENLENEIISLNDNNNSFQSVLSKTTKKIAINKASLEELLKIQTIDQHTAQKIIQLRLNGIYIDSPEDLSKKIGLNDNQIQLLLPQIDFSRINAEKQGRILDI